MRPRQPRCHGAGRGRQLERSRPGGEGHSAELIQPGDGNAHVILQAGRGAEAEVEQRGSEVGVTVQLGW